MLQKQNRLTGKDDFQKIHNRGRFVSDTYLALKVLSNDSKMMRVGFLVGLKVSKKSVIRNRVKRKLREIFRSLIGNKKLKGGCDIIVLVRPEIIEKKYGEIEEALLKTLVKAGLLLDKN